MGRTVLSFRQALNREIAGWADYRRGLSPEDRECFDALLDMARHRADASSLAARPLVSEAMFMSIITGLAGEVRRLRERVFALEKRLEKFDEGNSGGSNSGGSIP